ncbi:MAG: flagellar hook-length control protein FliK [Desulfobacteraceae bacterium]|nr:flagellar hook-length control protein FliK [Desulfobacteraceae bacterium]
MANLILPSPLIQTPPAPAEPRAQASASQDGSFAQHLDRQLRDTSRDQDSQLGAAQGKNSPPDDQKKADQPPASVEALLAQLMAQLKDAAQKPAASTPGAWSFQLKDSGLLAKLAAQSGMDSATLAQLRKQMDQQGGLKLTDLFSALESSLKAQETTRRVTVNETNLPLLETILSKLGVSPEAIKQLDSQSVNQGDQLDLESFLKGLEGVNNANQPGGGPASCVLSDWDSQQLTAMLSEAGVPSATISTLLPETMGLQQQALAGTPNQANQPVSMTLDRLKDILDQAIAAANQGQSKPDAPGLLTTLNAIVTQAGFAGKGVGWSPVIQGAMNTAYHKLQEMVDLSRDGKTAELLAKNDTLRQAWQASGQSQAVAATTGTESGNLAQGQGEAGHNGADGSLLMASHKPGEAAPDTISQLLSNPHGMETPSATPSGAEAAFKAPPPRSPFLTQLQQMAFDQISQGVLRGLKDNQHHLTLTLYPKELGEVKVDLQVRGSHLSANFVMENQKVKEALESGMNNFKDNLERRGFSLGSMSVSVGQDNGQGDSGQRFAEAWERSLSSGPANDNLTTPASVAAELAATQALNSPPGNSISLFV